MNLPSRLRARPRLGTWGAGSRFLFLVLLTAIVFLAVVFVVSLRTLEEYTYQTTREFAQVILDQTDGQIRRFFEDMEALVRGLAGTQAVKRADVPRMRDLFISAVDARKRYLRAIYLGTSDGRMYEWGKGADFSGWEPRLPPGYDPRSRPWYRKAIASPGFVVSPPYMYASVAALGISGSLALWSADGKLQGVLGIDILLQDLKRILESLKLPKGGIPLLVSDGGEVIAGQISGSKLSAESARLLLEAQALKTRLSGEEGSFGIDLNGDEILFVYRRNAELSGFVLVGMPREAAIASAKRLISALTLSELLAMAMLTLALSLIGNRLMGVPLAEISGVIARVESGDRGARAKTSTKDEFGLLARELNKLLDAEAEHANSLEEKVKRRTEELWSLQQENTRLKIGEERQRIYRDLHDSIGARLTNIFFAANVARRVASGDPAKAGELVDRIEENCLEAVRDLKDIVGGMREDQRIGKDFVSFTTAGIRQRLATLDIAFSHRVTERQAVNALDAETKSELGKVFDELVSNVLKHSGARKVSMRLSVSEDQIRLQFKDDGKGLHDGEAEPSRSGLGNISFRIERLGGNVKVASEAGKGTEFGICLPYRSSLSISGGAAW